MVHVIVYNVSNDASPIVKCSKSQRVNSKSKNHTSNQGSYYRFFLAASFSQIGVCLSHAASANFR